MKQFERQGKGSQLYIYLMYVSFFYIIYLYKNVYVKIHFNVLLSYTIESGSRIHERTIFVEVSMHNLESSQT